VDAQIAIRPELSSLKVEGARLLLQDGREVSLGQGGLSLGRAPENDVAITDPLISRAHARIRRSSQGFILEDLGSTHGTLLNGRRITEPAALNDGDHITLGSYLFTFRTGDGAGPAHSLILFFGARGGVGTTTLALNLAQKTAGSADQVCLVDASLERAHLTAMLHAEAAKHWGTLSKEPPERLVGALPSYLSHPLTGVSFLPAPEHIAEAETVNGRVVATVLDALRGSFPWTIVDTTSAFFQINVACFSRADAIYLVLSNDPMSVHSAAAVLELFSAHEALRSSIKVLLNQIWPESPLDVEQLKEVLQHPVDRVFPPRSEALLDAMLAGEPLALRNPADPFSQVIREMAGELVQLQPAAAPAKKANLSGLMKALFPMRPQPQGGQ